MTSVTFIADQEGSFEYYCSVGNHREEGMVGTLIVEDTKTDVPPTTKITHVVPWQSIYGIAFDGTSTGEAWTITLNNMTQVYASFIWLPEIWPDFFYEWRVVRKSPFDFISTWELMRAGDEYTNKWLSSGDYSEYTHYVLTLEPRDGDPAPAAHIFEWDM